MAASQGFTQTREPVDPRQLRLHVRRPDGCGKRHRRLPYEHQISRRRIPLAPRQLALRLEDDLLNSRGCPCAAAHRPTCGVLGRSGPGHRPLRARGCRAMGRASGAVATIIDSQSVKVAKGFVVLPQRWVVERSHAWVMHARRHARDCERIVQHSESLITRAAITLMTRRITQR
ncbi:transposase [Kitasatospora cineracea]